MAETRLLHEFVAPFACPDVAQADMPAVRAAYAAMMDAAAHLGRCHGLEPDDYILEHWADVITEEGTEEQGNAQPTTVRVEWLSTLPRFVDGLRQQYGAARVPAPAALVALRLRVLHSPAFNPFFRG
jgi:hypothetical protein